VYHIGFAPQIRDPLIFSGDALIDVGDFQPVRVFAKLTRRVLFVMRTPLGTDYSGFGYNIEYKRLQDGNYVPTSYGAVCKLRLLFHINRTLSISVDTYFEKADR